MTRLARFAVYLRLVCLLPLTCLAQSVDERILVSNPGEFVTRSSGVANQAQHALSDDGRYLLYYTNDNRSVSDTNGVGDLYLYDAVMKTHRFLGANAQGDSFGTGSGPGAISADGKVVAFSSYATNVVLNQLSDSVLYVRNLTSDEITQVPFSNTDFGAFGAFDISGDGRYVVFAHGSNTIVGNPSNGKDIFLYDISGNAVHAVSTTTGGSSSFEDSEYPSISTDGNFVAFASKRFDFVSGDTNGKKDIYVKRISTGTYSRASVATDGTESNADCENPTISGDGRYVTFESRATNLATGTSGGLHVYVHDLLMRTTTLLSRTKTGDPASGASEGVISRDGKFVAFTSGTVLTDEISNTNNIDVYRYDMQTGTILLVSGFEPGTTARGSSAHPKMNADGSYIAFDSTAQLLVEDTPDQNAGDVYRVHVSSPEADDFAIAARLKKGPTPVLQCAVKTDDSPTKGVSVRLQRSSTANGTFANNGAARRSDKKGRVLFSLGKFKKTGGFFRCSANGESSSSVKLKKKR